MRRGQNSYTPERHKTVIDAIRSGNTYTVAAALAGIGIDTLSRWRRAVIMKQVGKNPDGSKILKEVPSPKFAQFAADFARAEAECEVECVASIKLAGRPHDVLVTTQKTCANGDVITTTVKRREHDWTADAWWLERRRPDDWKKRESLEVESEGLEGKILKMVETLATRNEAGVNAEAPELHDEPASIEGEVKP